MTTQSSLLAWRIPIDGAWGHKESDRTDPLSTAQCAHARAHTHAHTHTHTHGKYCKVYYWFTQEDKVNVCFFPLCHLTG